MGIVNDIRRGERADGPFEILCYGDSNTWGAVACAPGDPPDRRYDRETRWPCVLQTLLGDGYAVTEEGLGNRTTVYTHDPDAPYLNGLTMLPGLLRSHRPLDLVILALGTNDLHIPTDVTEATLGDGIRRLIAEVRAHPAWGRRGRAPQILLISPPVIEPAGPTGRSEVYALFRCETGSRLSRLFPETWKRIAAEEHCGYVDAQRVTKPDPADGVHLTAASHIALAHAAAEAVRRMRTKAGITA